MAFPDNLAKLRRLAGEKGYRRIFMPWSPHVRELPLNVDVTGDAERHELGALKVAEEGLKAST